MRDKGVDFEGHGSMLIQGMKIKDCHVLSCCCPFGIYKIFTPKFEGTEKFSYWKNVSDFQFQTIKTIK